MILITKFYKKEIGKRKKEALDALQRNLSNNIITKIVIFTDTLKDEGNNKLMILNSVVEHSNLFDFANSFIINEFYIVSDIFNIFDASILNFHKHHKDNYVLKAINGDKEAYIFRTHENLIVQDLIQNIHECFDIKIN